MEGARLPCGPGQFRAFLDDGTRVTDATITEWEKKALSVVQSDLDVDVKRHSHSTLHVILDLSQAVGYTGGTGRVTSRMRVEISQWTVHSHPC